MSSSGYIIVQGAKCHCQFGTTPDSIKVLTQKKRFINDKNGQKKLIATNKDVGQTLEKNSFGSCSKLNGNPCKATITQWVDFYEKVKLEDNGGYVLLEGSKGTCPIGVPSCISFLDHGQQANPSSQAMENSDEAILSQLNPLVPATVNEGLFDKIIISVL